MMSAWPAGQEMRRWVAALPRNVRATGLLGIHRPKPHPVNGMAAAWHHRTPKADRDDLVQTPMRNAVTTAQPPGNDNLEQAGAIEALATSKKRTWELFVRWLWIGGLLGALTLVTLLVFVYSGYP
jgi:hypothetical protein